MIDDLQLSPFVQISKTGCHVDILRKHYVFVSRLYFKSLFCEQRLSYDKFVFIDGPRFGQISFLSVFV